MEGNTSNARSSLTTNATRVGLTSDVFVDAIVGQGYQFAGANGYLQANYSPTIFNDKKLALAAWVNPSANTRGTIMRARELLRRRQARDRQHRVGVQEVQRAGPQLPRHGSEAAARPLEPRRRHARWHGRSDLLERTARAHRAERRRRLQPEQLPGHDRRRRQQCRLLQGRTRRAPDLPARAERRRDRAAVPRRQRRGVRAEADVVPDRGADPGLVRVADVCVRRAPGRRRRPARRRTGGRADVAGRRLAGTRRRRPTA